MRSRLEKERRNYFMDKLLRSCWQTGLAFLELKKDSNNSALLVGHSQDFHMRPSFLFREKLLITAEVQATF
jgi:hypothetical protein